MGGKPGLLEALQRCTYTVNLYSNALRCRGDMSKLLNISCTLFSNCLAICGRLVNDREEIDVMKLSE